MASTPCSHLSSILILEGPDEVDGCDTCLVEGTKWLHLRMCMSCGLVGCCDDSPQQHARKHAEAEQHPPLALAQQQGRGVATTHPHGAAPARHGEALATDPVSYTHLTLPTSDLV